MSTDLMKLITTTEGRAKLAPSVNGQPYFVKVGGGQYLGVRIGADRAEAWAARVRVKLMNGKHEQRYTTLGTFAGYAEALAAANVWFAQQGSTPKAERLATVAAVCDAHLEHMKEKTNKEAGDIQKARNLLRNATLDAIGAMDPERLNALHVNEWRDRLVRGERGYSDARSKLEVAQLRPLKPQSVNRIKKQLFAALNWAADSGRLTNRAWRIESNLEEVDVEEGKFIEPQHRAQLQAAAKGSFADYLLCIMNTGARPIELSRCTRRDLDLTKSTATIRLRTKKGKGGKWRERVCGIPAVARPAFERFAAGKLPLAPLFTREDGQPMLAADTSLAFTALAQSLGLEYALYDTRHTRIASLLAARVDAQSVAKSTGTSLQVIDRSYSKYLPEAAQNVAAVAS